MQIHAKWIISDDLCEFVIQFSGDSFISEDSAIDGVTTSNREITGNKEWEMMYKGAVHFK